jgi:hypothetical protein
MYDKGRSFRGSIIILKLLFFEDKDGGTAWESNPAETARASQEVLKT